VIHQDLEYLKDFNAAVGQRRCPELR